MQEMTSLHACSKELLQEAKVKMVRFEQLSSDLIPEPTLSVDDALLACVDEMSNIHGLLDGNMI